MDSAEFLRKISELKEVKRTGWIYKDVPNPESVADHSYAVAMIAMIVPVPKGVDREDLVKMALVHDFAELEIGDIVWESGNFSNPKKQKSKHTNELRILSSLFEKIKRDDLKKLAVEFLEQTTSTAQFCKEIDKLEMSLQALAYESKVPPSQLNEFWENTDRYLKDPNLRKLFVELSKRRSQ